MPDATVATSEDLDDEIMESARKIVAEPFDAGMTIDELKLRIAS
ncbi:hypothetical protein U8C31_18275 [Sinorhizobium medicae]|nr:hypothetical protein [Sinorhizobium medicae]WQO72184.1 hypothetical protein U8C31_18275 [Sinorhizobium medicae]